MRDAAKPTLFVLSFTLAACGGSSGPKSAACPTGQHDGGDGKCVALGACSVGYHDGGGGVCLADLVCAAGYHEGGGGKCTTAGTCSPGYTLATDGSCVNSGTCPTGTHDNGAGMCVADAICPTGYHEGGTGTCVPAGACSSGYHDGGGGDCAIAGSCSSGYHDGGDGTCVPLVACSASYHDGGNGVCVRDGRCSPGYHDGGDGRCTTLDQCSAGYHDGGDGTCWLASECAYGYDLDGSGRCVVQQVTASGGSGGTTVKTDGGPAGGGGVVGTGGVSGTGGAFGTGGVVGRGGSAGRGAGGTGGTTITTPAICGNGIKEGNETCDDGNTIKGDGCDPSCTREEGYACPVDGRPCVKLVGCGNGILTADEACDDGNTIDGDGCSGDCAVIEDGFECRVPGKRCTPKCGDGRLIAYENCDDGNTVSGDGCSSTCQVEPGADCPTPGQPCAHPLCGNGKVERGEICDCGVDPARLPSGCNSVNGLFYGDGKGCSRYCTREPSCRDSAGKNQACSSACGDGNVDPGESCDDGNQVDGDGCSSDCKVEDGFTCSTITRQGSSTCQSGSGQCLELPIIYRDFQPENATSGGRHPDFYFLGTQYGSSNAPTTLCVPNSAGPAKGNDSTARCWGIVADTLLDGKPQPGSTKTCACQFSDWSIGNSGRIPGGYTQAANDSPLSDGAGTYQGGLSGTPVNTTSTTGPYTGTLIGYTSTSPGGPIWKGTTPAYKDASSLKQWYTDDSSVNKTFTGFLELQSIGTNLYQYASKTLMTGRSFAGTGFFPLDTLNPSQVTLCNLWPYWNHGSGNPIWTTCTGDQYLFPPHVTQASCDSGDNVDDGCWVTGAQGVKHDSYFTDEVHYDFVYDGATGIALQFFGDDDLFIFINGTLVLDLGGVHQPLPGKVTVTGDPGDANVVEGGCMDTAGNITGTTTGSTACSPKNSSPPAAATPDDFRTRKVSLGLQTGRVYEIVIFGADRHPPESNYQLNLQGFTTKQSDCRPRCGDGIVTAGEECDCGAGSVPVPDGCPGPNNDATYGGCSTTCHFGPFCGDGIANGPEECDLGKNNGDSALGADGCSAGCMRPRFCGDGIVDVSLGEECDLGINNGQDQQPCDKTCHLVSPFGRP